MIRGQHLTIVIPCYNEAKLIGKTVTTLPAFVDAVMLVDDYSKDDTLTVMKELQKSDKRLTIVRNDVNRGVGYSVVHGFRNALETKTNLIMVMAGDAQCDPAYIEPMVAALIEGDLDYVKANRFKHREALLQMPAFRRIGNIFITLLTKFATGYYTIFDSQNGFGVFRRSILEAIDLGGIGRRYDYESTLLIELSIAGAKISDVPVPAIYGDEVSTIPIARTALRTLQVLERGFWRRVYRKYVLINFHPMALFLSLGLLFATGGLVIGLIITYLRVVYHLSPSTGTVMLCVLPFFTGFQLILTAIVMDIMNEGR
jgi:glycosyltransferase involved in cell wall biosynthesis